MKTTLHCLTQREWEILALVASGKTNREIGEELYISWVTARNHVSNLLSKLNCRSRIEAATLLTSLQAIEQQTGSINGSHAP